MVDVFRTVIGQIDEKMIKNWAADLVIVKNCIGLKFREVILAKL